MPCPQFLALKWKSREVVQKDVPIVSEWVATLDGYVNAQIQPQVTGYIIGQTYKEGSFVGKGQVLFQIDPRPFQAVVDQAEGQLAQAATLLRPRCLLDPNKISPVHLPGSWLRLA